MSPDPRVEKRGLERLASRSDYCARGVKFRVTPKPGMTVSIEWVTLLMSLEGLEERVERVPDVEDVFPIGAVVTGVEWRMREGDFEDVIFDMAKVNEKLVSHSSNVTFDLIMRRATDRSSFSIDVSDDMRKVFGVFPDLEYENGQ